jgi:hypothetical protein
LCEADDVAALWAYQGLQARGLAPLELISAQMLERGVRWEHRLGADGVSITISLTQDRTIRGDAIRGVLNRLVTVPTGWLLKVEAEDRNYATQELAAFFLSWLYALPAPVLNRPTPQGLSGSWRRLSEWVWLAARAGLPTPAYRRSSRDYINEGGSQKSFAGSDAVNTVIIIEGHVVSRSAPPDIIRGCQRLAKLANIALLGVEFVEGSEGHWTFANAVPLPDLQLGGEVLLDVLAAVLRGVEGTTINS